MKYTLVGINAPTLDNSDECTFIKNEDLLYATAGDESSGSAANLVLYEKLIDKGCHHLYDSPDISRKTFKTGTWGMPENGIDKPYLGGDYYLSSFAHIKASLFRTGKLNKIRLKFFTKDSYTTENPQLLIPNTEFDASGGKTLWEHLNDKTANPALPTKIVFLQPNIQNDKQDGWSFGAFARLDLDNLPSANEDWYDFIFESDFYITPNMIKEINYSFAIVVLTNADNWRSNNKNAEEFFNSSDKFTSGALRVAIGNGDSNNVVVTRSVPRGSIDGISYVYAPTTDTYNGTANGQNRLLELEYCIDTDLVNEYFGENADKHHLDIKEVQELNTLRYSAPLLPDNTWESLNVAVDNIFISDESLRKFNNIDLTNKRITSIRIPFKLKTPEDYLVNAMFQNHLLARYGGLCHTNREAIISLDGGQTSIRSTNFLAYSYFDDAMVYEWFFESDELNALKYKGQGIKISGAPPVGEQGNNTLAVEIFRKNNNFYAYSANDIINTTNSNYRNINATPGIKVMFDYMQRGEWFDYIENKENETYSIVKNSANNELSNIFKTIKTYDAHKNDRIRFKWAEFCEAHSTPLKGVLKEVKVIMSHNQWTAYDNEVYLCIYEEESENVFVKKAVSTNSLIPKKYNTEVWYFENVELTGKTIRVGLIADPDGILHDIGDNQPSNPSLQTNAITGTEGYDGECYICNDNGVRQNFGCPMEFVFHYDILQKINVLENNVVTNQNNLNEHINNNIIHVTQEEKDKWNSIFNNAENDNAISAQQLNLGKWRIYINANGDLVIDTEALAAAGKSIIFNDVEL